METFPTEIVRREKEATAALSTDWKSRAGAQTLTRRPLGGLSHVATCLCFSAGFDGMQKVNNRKTSEAKERKRGLNWGQRKTSLRV